MAADRAEDARTDEALLDGDDDDFERFDPGEGRREPLDVELDLPGEEREVAFDRYFEDDPELARFASVDEDDEVEDLGFEELEDVDLDGPPL